MVDYTISIKRPFSDITKLAIGILLSVIPIVNFIALGFQLECSKTAMKKKFDLPEWKEIGGLFITGLIAAIICVSYAIIPLGVIIFTGGALVYSIWTAIMTGATPAIGSLIVGAGIGLFVGLLLLLFAIYIVPVAILNYISTGKFGSAFDIGGIIGKAFSINYFVSWLVAVVYAGILGIVLSLIPFIGMAISSFIGGVTFWTIIGQVYAEKK